MLSRFLRKPKELDEGALRLKAEKSARARELLGNELMQDAFRVVEDVYVQAWRRTTVEEIETRERAWLALQLLNDIKSHLEMTVAEGVAAQKLIEASLRLEKSSKAA